MDDKSTSIASLNNKSDDSEVVNKILTKFNNLQDGNDSQERKEEKFENRDFNKEIYNLNSNNDAYKEHHQKELQRTSQLNHVEQDDDNMYEEDYDEYEVIEIPLWKRILNEIRIPIFIFILVLVFFNCSFDKFLLNKVAFFGNQYNECNTYGFLLKAFLISLLSYLLIRFVRI